MLKKIILPIVLLIFTQQDFYGTEESNEDTEVLREKKTIKNKRDALCEISKYINFNYASSELNSPLLWLLWAFLDNVPFQYGNSKKILKHGEAYYGLSNGIGFFPSFLNFGWLKIGIIDAHINVINAITNYIKIHIERKIVYYNKLLHPNVIKKDLDAIFELLLYNFIDCLYASVAMTGLHLLSFNFLNCVKVKIISIGAFVVSYCAEKDFDDKLYSRWYFFPSLLCTDERILFDKMSYLYVFLSPRIEINISGIINYSNGK